MGTLLSQPSTEKDSESGNFKLRRRELSYAATGMQGWRMSMEDVRSVTPKLDEETALFAVYDGHGGKEVALYCSARIPELLVSSGAWKSGNKPLALQEAFLECDRLLATPEAVEEMKKLLLNDRKDGLSECVDEDIDTCKLMEEAKMPLEDLLGQYKQFVADKSIDGDDEEEDEETDTDDVSSMLKMVASRMGITIDFENSEDSSEEEKEDEDEEQDEGEAENVEAAEGEEEGNEEKSEEGGTEDESEQEDEMRDSTKEGGSDREEDEQSEDEDDGYSRKERTQKGNHEETSKLYTETGSHSNHVGAASENTVVANCGTSKLFAARDCDSSGSDLGCILSEPANVDLSDKHSCSSPLTPNEDAVDGEVLLNGSQTVERTVYEKNACLIDLLTSGVDCAHNNHMKTVEEHAGVQNSSRKRKAPYTAGPATKKKSCRLSPDEIEYTMGIHSGTTAVVCVLRENQLIVANAGDSRCVLSCKGECVDLSEDHKPNDAPELFRIKRAGGKVGADGRVNGGLNVSRALGDHLYKKNSRLPLAEQMITAMPDLRVRDISEDDEFIVLACDGIWNVMSSQEAVDFVRVRMSEQLANGTHDLGKICESLCDACLAPSSDNDGTGCDNMTCIIVLLHSPSEFLQNEL